jgi:hypothetical protein
LDPETQRWAWGIAIGVVLSLIGVVFWMVWAEVKRLAKNIHELRGQVAPLSLWVAVIKEKLRIGDDDERG